MNDRTAVRSRLRRALWACLFAWALLGLPALTAAGDLDVDNDVDVDDIAIILAHLGDAAGAGDPKDLDGDGVVTVLDARLAVLACTRSLCDAVLTGVGTWNAKLYPWREDAQLAEVIAAIPRGLSVLALQEVYRADDAQAIASQLSADYPYWYFAPPVAVPTVQCQALSNNCFNFFGMQLDCVVEFAYGYANAIVNGNVDATRLLWEYQTPNATPTLYFDFLSLVDGHCPACLHSLFHAGVAPADAAMQCVLTGGPAYTFGGSPGLMVLAKSPIENVATATLPTWLRAYVIVTAQIDGLTYAFTQWPQSPGTEPFHTGDLQPEFAQLAIGLDPDLIVGDLASGDAFQSSAYDSLLAAGYIDATATLFTWCPATMADHPSCAPFGRGPADTSKVLLRDATGAWMVGSPALFNQRGTDSGGAQTLSEHAGVAVPISLP